MASKYPFEHKEIMIKRSAHDSIALLDENGYNPEHILGSYLCFKNGIKDSNYPCVDRWSGISGADFLTAYCAYLGERKQSKHLMLESEYGIDCNFVSARFFRSIKANEHILIINPHPQFVQSLSGAKARTTITYTNDRYSEIMQTSKAKSSIEAAQLHQLKAAQYNRVLIFAQNLSTEQIATCLNQIKPYMAENKDTIIYVQMPSKHMDNKHHRPVLRQVFRADYAVNQVILLDPNAVIGHDKKKLLLILRNSSPSTVAQVVIQKNGVDYKQGESISFR